MTDLMPLRTKEAVTSYKAERGWTIFRPTEHLIGDRSTSPYPIPVDDGRLIERIIAAYNRAITTDFGENFWTEIFGPMKQDIHTALRARDISGVTQMLREPHTNMLQHGFEHIKMDFIGLPADYLASYATTIHDVLIRFAEAVGSRRVEHPEGYQLDKAPPPPVSIETVLEEIDLALPTPLTFPNPFSHEPGLKTSRGVASYRAVQSAFQGLRIASLAKEIGGPVLEIGGNLGRTAYYSVAFGVADYTIIDIPMTSVAQSYYLGRTLGDDAVSLFGEPLHGKIKLLPPSSFLSESGRYGLVVNIDSLPEISDDMAGDYIATISRNAERFLSINHETLSTRTVRDIVTACGGKSISRNPYWLRRGYIEELFSF